MTRLHTNIRVRGVCSQDGRFWGAFKHRRREILAPHDQVLAQPRETVRDIAAQGIALGGQASIAQLFETINGIDRFSKGDVLSKPGWNGPVIARSDGEVFVPPVAQDGGSSPSVGFYRHPSRYRHCGKLSSWKAKSAASLLGDDGATLLIAAALAPVLRPLASRPMPPFGLEIVTPDAAMARAIIHSVLGSMQPDILAFDSLDSVVADPARYVAASRHCALPLCDLGDYLLGASDKKRFAAFRRLLFDKLLASAGGDVNASGMEAPMFVLIGRRRVSDLLSLNAAPAERVGEGLLTICMDSVGRSIGPASSGFPDQPSSVWSGQFALQANYGVALRAFQQRLVKRRSEKGFSELQDKVDGDIAFFRHRAGKTFQREQLPDHLVLPFALLYATIRAARLLKVLPRVEGKEPAIWRVFERWVAARPKPPTAADILAQIARHPDVRLYSEISPAATKAELENVPAFIKELEDGRRELLVPSGQKKKIFDWPSFKQLPDFNACYLGRREKKRYGAKHALGAWTHARVLRFKLP